MTRRISHYSIYIGFTVDSCRNYSHTLWRGLDPGSARCVLLCRLLSLSLSLGFFYFCFFFFGAKKALIFFIPFVLTLANCFAAADIFVGAAVFFFLLLL